MILAIIGVLFSVVALIITTLNSLSVTNIPDTVECILYIISAVLMLIAIIFFYKKGDDDDDDEDLF